MAPATLTATSVIVDPTTTQPITGLPNTGRLPGDRTDGGLSTTWLALLVAALGIGFGLHQRRIAQRR